MEVNVAIICGCLPLMRPMFEGCLGRMSSTGYSRSKTSQSNPASASQLYYRSTASHNDKTFQRLHDVKSKAWSPSDKNSERQLCSGTTRSRSDVERSSSEIELQGIGVQTDIYQTTEESQKEQRGEHVV